MNSALTTWLASCRIAASCSGIRLTVLRVFLGGFLLLLLLLLLFQSRAVFHFHYTLPSVPLFWEHFMPLSHTKNPPLVPKPCSAPLQCRTLLSPLACLRSQFASAPARTSPPAPVFFSQRRASYRKWKALQDAHAALLAPSLCRGAPCGLVLSPR